MIRGWNLRPLRTAPAPTLLDASPVPYDELSPAVRAQLLGVFRRLAAVLQLTAQLAQAAGRSELHAAFGARLAIFQARVAAGAAGPRLALALSDFGRELEVFITAELGCRRA